MSSDEMLQTVTNGFISYRRVDNEDFGGVVDEIRATLSAIFEARTGQVLHLFIDRESIGWGEDWREKVLTSVKSATVFIPVVTLRYFNSQACLDELLAFDSAARNLGVTDLILPIVLFGSDEISEDHERHEVRLIARLNYKSIEAAWRAGYDSAEWRQAMSDCAASLADALRRAEEALAAAEIASAGAHRPGGARSGRDPSPSDAGELVEIDDDFDIEAMTARLHEVTSKLEEATSIFGELSDIMNAAFGDQEELQKLTSAQTNARLLATARDMRDPALRLEAAGTDAEAAMLTLDPELRELVSNLSRLSLPQAREQLDGLLEGAQGIDGVDEVSATISQFIEMIQFISLMNVNVRKSLRPAVRGLRSFQSAFNIFQGWRELGN